MEKLKLKYEKTMKNGNCLYNEKPIVVNRELAGVLGDVDLAIILQEIHYWININKQNTEMGLSSIITYYDECFWCFRTYEEWLLDFPWLSLRTLKSKIKKLEDMELLISNNFNKLNIDRTKWYTINYDKLAELEQQFQAKKEEKRKQREERKEKQKEYKKRKKAVDNSVDNMLKQCGQTPNSCQNSESAKIALSPKCKNCTIESAKIAPPIQEENIQEINYIQEGNNVCLSVDKEDIKENNNDGQTDEQTNNNFKIELNTEDELNKFIIKTANDLFNQKTIKLKNKNVPVIDIVTEIKKLDLTTLNKLIEYVANKFINNKNNIKNEETYIKTLFSNAIFEKRYKFEKPAENSNTNNGYYGTNKFCNFKQRPFDPELLRKIELKDLKGDDDNEDVIKGLYDDCSTYEEFQNRYKELHGKKNEDEEEYLIKEDDEEELPF